MKNFMLHGKNFLGSYLSSQAAESFQSPNLISPAPNFYEATSSEINLALSLAARDFQAYRLLSSEKRAQFLESIASGIEGLGEDLLSLASLETGLAIARLESERLRTTSQLRMFAALIRDGSWLGVRIDLPLPDRKPLPKPDLRRTLIPLGPIVVFGASNFPLAFSVAGGDTAAALAAGNPVIVKGHPAHPGTSELVAGVIQKSAITLGLPEGVFSLLHGASFRVGTELVEHAQTKAVAFTGSLKGGRALFDVAARRPEPIPVFAEMGSTNPVFLLPGALKERGKTIAQGLFQSFTVSNGQLCTKPGLVLGLQGEHLQQFSSELSMEIRSAEGAKMLHQGICNSFYHGTERLESRPGVELLERSAIASDPSSCVSQVVAFRTSGAEVLADSSICEEVFGPTSVVVWCENRNEMLEVANSLSGQLTASIHGTEEDLLEYTDLLRILETKVGRLIFNGFPTGLEVCPSQNHTGPYPATTNMHFTAVGPASIYRFVRPIVYQNFPQSVLPTELVDENSGSIHRMVDGNLSQS